MFRLRFAALNMTSALRPALLRLLVSNCLTERDSLPGLEIEILRQAQDRLSTLRTKTCSRGPRLWGTWLIPFRRFFTLLAALPLDRSAMRVVPAHRMQSAQR